MKGLLRLKMQLVTMNSAPQKRRLIFLCCFRTNKANKVFQEAQDLIAKMMITTHKDLMKVVKNNIQHASNMCKNNKYSKMAIGWMFLCNMPLHLLKVVQKSQMQHNFGGSKFGP
jgi:predicted membrane chloride channel (bestrophin family)